MIDIYLPTLVDGEDKGSQIKNRIRKNYRHLRKWAKRTFTDCFRIYDRDIKEYPLAIDFYAGRFSVQFFSFDRDCDEPSEELKAEIDSALMALFSVTIQHIYWRTRMRRARTQQYEKRDETDSFFIVHEYGVKFKVNLNDYLDTGLFLDHRETRRLVASMAKGKRVLNLFAYTCSFSVHAALAGALSTHSVDLSNTYTQWGKDNFILNHLPLKNHEILRADCLKYLDSALRHPMRFDLIIVDPPTLSRSKKMEQLFEIQVDYPSLITKGLRLLAPEGILFFSTNSRQFKLDPDLLPPCLIKDISEKTLPQDFRNKKIHRCWKISPNN